MIHIRKPDMRDIYLSLVQTSLLWYLFLFAYVWHVPEHVRRFV